MEIREAIDQDIPGILNVLKRSLGETSSQKTEAVWRYKHLDNPFGKSLVLLAVFEGEIVGVRAFMRWKWQVGEKAYSAFRAVDTATDPDHQGKGIFKKLTLKALEIGKSKGYNFVFNTPNDQSRPGYIKMGWEIVGKIFVNIRPNLPINFVRKIDFQNSRISDKVLVTSNSFNTKNGFLFTPKDQKYINWRYKNCLLQDYLILENEEMFVAAYIKKHKYFNELRISEFIVSGNDKLAKTQILKWAKIYKALIITSSNRIFSLGLKGNFGPVLTLKDLNLKSSEKKFGLKIENWNNTLGDLELF